MAESPEDAMRRLGRQVRAARKARGLVQADVTSRSGVDRVSVAKLENGITNSKIEAFVSVGDAVGLSLVYVPTERLNDVLQLIAQPRVVADATAGAGGVFDDVFVAPEDEDDPEEAPSHGP